MRSSMCLSTSSLKPSIQNKSNKQSMLAKLCNIKLFVSSADAKNLVKNSMHIFMQPNQFCTVSGELHFGWSGTDSKTSKPLFTLEGSILPDLLHSCAWTQATCRTRETAFKVLQEVIVFSGESCKIRTKLLTRRPAISGLQAECSSASSKADNSVYNQNKK